MGMDRERESFDRQLAAAYRKLGGPLLNMADAMCVLKIVAEETVLRPEPWLAERIKTEMPDLAKHRVHALTPDEEEALAYIIRHVGDLACKLRQNYDDSFIEIARGV